MRDKIMQGLAMQKEAHAKAVAMFAEKTTDELIETVLMFAALEMDARAGGMPTLDILPQHVWKMIVTLAWMKISDIAMTRKLADMTAKN